MRVMRRFLALMVVGFEAGWETGSRSIRLLESLALSVSNVTANYHSIARVQLHACNGPVEHSRKNVMTWFYIWSRIVVRAVRKYS